MPAAMGFEKKIIRYCDGILELDFRLGVSHHFATFKFPRSLTRRSDLDGGLMEFS
jgi:hypothetical protein